MATNLKIDDALLTKALKLGKKRTKKATVTEALTEYIQRRLQKKIVNLFGELEYDPSFDYKAQRKRQ